MAEALSLDLVCANQMRNEANDLAPLDFDKYYQRLARKMRKLGKRGYGHLEAAFGPDWCKGHFGDHGQLTLSRYEDRMRTLESHLA